MSQKEWLTRFVALMLTAFLGLFLVDKLVSFGTPLLSPEMSNGLFELIKNIVLIAMNQFVSIVLRKGLIQNKYYKNYKVS